MVYIIRHYVCGVIQIGMHFELNLLEGTEFGREWEIKSSRLTVCLGGNRWIGCTVFNSECIRICLVRCRERSEEESHLRLHADEHGSEVAIGRWCEEDISSVVIEPLCADDPRGKRNARQGLDGIYVKLELLELLWKSRVLDKYLSNLHCLETLVISHIQFADK